MGKAFDAFAPMQKLRVINRTVSQSTDDSTVVTEVHGVHSPVSATMLASPAKLKPTWKSAGVTGASQICYKTMSVN